MKMAYKICPCGIGPDTHTHNADHVFERAGLGKAPFKYLGYEHKTYQACPGAPIQVGGSCDYCCTGITNMFYFQSADGKRFKVGSECAKRSGDKGAIHAVKTQINADKKAKRKASEAESIDWLLSNLAAVQQVFGLHPHPLDYRAKKGETLWQWAHWMLANSGNAGKMLVVKKARKMIADDFSKWGIK